MAKLTVDQLLSMLGEPLKLTLVSKSIESSNDVASSSISRPGLVLAGLEKGFLRERVQVLGEPELAFLDSFAEQGRRDALARLCAASVPCIIVADGLTPPSDLVDTCNECGIPLMATELASDTLVHELVSCLDDLLAPETTVHGTLVDVYGVGLLFTGKSGIGKSECGLDLVEKGHRLVADDVVRVIRTPRDHLVGSGSALLEHYMEIRGVGIIDVRSMFGVRGIRRSKRIEVEVRLSEWTEAQDYERLGIEDTKTDILGVEIPLVVLPLVPGKNITVLSEVIGLNHRLKLCGVHPAREFDKRLRDRVQMKAEERRILRGDDE